MCVFVCVLWRRQVNTAITFVLRSTLSLVPGNFHRKKRTRHTPTENIVTVIRHNSPIEWGIRRVNKPRIEHGNHFPPKKLNVYVFRRVPSICCGSVSKSQFLKSCCWLYQSISFSRYNFYDFFPWKTFSGTCVCGCARSFFPSKRSRANPCIPSHNVKIIGGPLGAMIRERKERRRR
jgi:hypothetical protein